MLPEGGNKVGGLARRSKRQADRFAVGKIDFRHFQAHGHHDRNRNPGEDHAAVDRQPTLHGVGKIAENLRFAAT